MLRRDDEGRYLLRRIAHVSHADLRLTVGSQPRDRTGGTCFGEGSREALRQHEWQWQPLRSLVRGVSIDDPLIAGAQHAVVAHHAHGDVAALRIDRHAHGAGVRVDPLLCRLVPNVANDTTHDLHDLVVT
jgi:hypothetical protein